MEYRVLGGSGFKVPALCFGTGTFGGGSDFFRAWGSTQAAEATRLADLCLDAGACMFDSADAYSGGMAEEILGAALKGRRSRAIVSTKASFAVGDGPNDLGHSRHHLTEACEASLHRLGTDYIDLWQLHAFDALTETEETLRALDDLVRSGKVRLIGCSNFSGWHLMKSLSISERRGWARYWAHQAYYSLAGRDYEWELMPLALDQKVGTVVWSPLAGGLLSGKVGRGRPAPAGSRVGTIGAEAPALPEELLFSITDALEEVAKESGKSVAQVALNWVLHRPSVSTVIIGARDEAQLRKNLAAGDFKLDAGQTARLDAASERAPAYPYWHQRANFSGRNPRPV